MPKTAFSSFPNSINVIRFSLQKWPRWRAFVLNVLANSVGVLSSSCLQHLGYLTVQALMASVTHVTKSKFIPSAKKNRFPSRKDDDIDRLQGRPADNDHEALFHKVGEKPHGDSLVNTMTLTCVFVFLQRSRHRYRACFVKFWLFVLSMRLQNRRSGTPYEVPIKAPGRLLSSCSSVVGDFGRTVLHGLDKSRHEKMTSPCFWQSILL